MDRREMKGMQMAHLGRISETPKGWIVPSESGSGAYLVYKEDEETKCNCPDCQMGFAPKVPKSHDFRSK